MKNNFKQIIAIAAICIFGFAQALHAQSVYKITDSKDNDMKLSGTSTFHDWVMNAQSFTGEASFDFKQGTENELTAVKSLTFTLPVLNLKSGESGLDKNAYKALKTKQYSTICYKLVSATVSSEKDSKYLLKTNGELTIAGVTKEITMDVYCVVNSDGTIVATGSDKLNMTDYQVKPPTFMVIMKTGDAITLDFTSVYKRINEQQIQANSGK